MEHQELFSERDDSPLDSASLDTILLDVTEAADSLRDDPDYVASVLQAHFVSLIRKTMREDNLSVTQLAAKLNKSRQYVSRVLNENVNFTLKSMAEITCALHLEIDVNVSRTDQPFQVLYPENAIYFQGSCVQHTHAVARNTVHAFTRKDIEKKTPLEVQDSDRFRYVG